MSFSIHIAVSSLSPGVIQLTDNSVLDGTDLLSNFTNRIVTITMADGNPLPNATGTPASTPLRATINWPITTLTGQKLIIPTNLSWDVVLSIQVQYVVFVANPKYIYLNLNTFYSSSFISQYYLQAVDSFYVSRKMTSNKAIVNLNKRISNTMDAADIAISTNDLPGCQYMLDLLHDLCSGGGLYQ